MQNVFTSQAIGNSSLNLGIRVGVSKRQIEKTGKEELEEKDTRGRGLPNTQLHISRRLRKPYICPGMGAC